MPYSGIAMAPPRSTRLGNEIAGFDLTFDA